MNYYNKYFSCELFLDLFLKLEIKDLMLVTRLVHWLNDIHTSFPRKREIATEYSMGAHVRAFEFIAHPTELNIRARLPDAGMYMVSCVH